MLPNVKGYNQQKKIGWVWEGGWCVKYIILAKK